MIFKNLPQVVKTMPHQSIGVDVGAGLTARPAERGQAPAYDDPVGCYGVSFKDHGQSREFFHANGH